MIFPRFVLLLLAAVMPAAACLKAGPQPDEAGMTVRFMSWQGDLTGLWMADGGSFVPVKAGEFVLGRPVSLRDRTSPVRLFREQTAADGVTHRLPVAEVPLPGGVRSVLVVLSPAPAGSPLPLEGRALDQSLAVHPLNTMRVVNFSRLKLALRVGGALAVIAPGAEDNFPFPSKGPLSLTMEVAVGTAEGWQMVQRSLQPAPPGRRILVIVRDGRPDYSIEDPALRTKPVDTVFLIDRVPPAPVPAVARK